MYEYGNLTSLNIDDVLPNRFQPRIYFDEHKLNELAESIRKYGVIQPIVVRQIGGKYEIIAGERRYKASKIANKSTIPAIVINLNDKESEEIALLENVQRQNLTPIEEAVSYKRILDMGYITQMDLAEKLGKTQSTIANKIRLLNLDDQVQYALLNGKISERHARSLLRIHDKNKQIEMLNRIINERLTVKKTDDAINELLENKDEPMENQETINEVDKKVLNGSLELSNELDSQKESVSKVPFVKSEPVEDLFGENEPIKKPVRAVARGSHEIIRVSLPKDLEEKLMRKEEKGMDIDKIMREAQDINVPDENKDISNLMKHDGNASNIFEPVSVPSEPIVSVEAPVNNDIPLVNEDQNKFVNFNGIVQPEEPKNEVPVMNNEVTFDSIFNQAPIDLQSQTAPAENVEPIMPAADDSMSIAAAVQKAMNSNAPEKEINDSISNNVVPENNFVNNEPTMISPSKSDENSTDTSSLYSELMQPESTSAIAPKPLEPINSEPIMPVLDNNVSEGVLPVSPVSEVISPVISNIPEPDILEAPMTQSMASNVSEPVDTVASNNFALVVRLIRNCADEIEKLGYSIDLDEIDLGNSYQATFKINKEK